MNIMSTQGLSERTLRLGQPQGPFQETLRGPSTTIKAVAIVNGKSSFVDEASFVKEN